MAYLLDANVFIEAKNRHYGFDFCPAFWEWIVSANGDGTVFSIEPVHRELLRRDDELAAWTAAHADGLFLSSTPESFAALDRVDRWATGRGYRRMAIDAFARVADSHLIAHAVATGHEVVTHEVPSASRKKIKIPDACVGLGIMYLTPFEMLRREGARFVLSAVA